MSGRTVTRADLTEAVYQLGVENKRTEFPEPISRDESAALVETVLSEISDALVRGETVKLSSFGTFSVREKGERVGRNPKTLQAATITPRRVVSFRASHVLKDQINGVEDVEPERKAG